MEVTEAPSVHRATELVCQFYQQFIYKAFTSKQLSRICTLYLRRSLCRRHLRDIALPPSLRYSVCLLYKTFSLSLHISEEPKNKILHNCTPSKILTVKNESVLEYAFPTFIPISLIFYNKRNPKYESSCHSCHKRTAYNLLTYSRFT